MRSLPDGEIGRHLQNNLSSGGVIFGLRVGSYPCRARVLRGERQTIYQTKSLKGFHLILGYWGFRGAEFKRRKLEGKGLTDHRCIVI